MSDSPHQRYCIIDFETRSEANLKKVGVYEYARHPSTQILCVAWRIGTRAELCQQLKRNKPAKIWSPAFWDKGADPEELDEVLMDKDIVLVAHNATFEQVITRFVLSKLFLNGVLRDEMPPNRWMCTASIAAAHALPRKLEGACLALDLPIKKDMDGRRLILKYCKPRKATKKNPAKWHNLARELRRIMLYCQTDIDAETWLFLSLPPLSEQERKVWLLDQKINFTGFQADRQMATTALKLIAEETKRLNAETMELTNGDPGSTTQRRSVLEWLQREGVFLPDLRAKTVSDALIEGMAQGSTKRILQIRQAISKVSTKKYSAFDARSCTDGRVRDILVYHTASTGRWGGSGLQPQNFPRGNIQDTDTAADILKSGDLELIRLIYGDPMAMFSSCLRSVITAPKGRRLLCADYAAIEARVLFWVAKHDVGLKSFFENRPVYEEMASIIYNVLIEEVTKIQRQIGKQAFLGCGYGMGWKKFILTCKNYGMEIDEITAQAAVKAYRNHHSPVVELWTNLELAAIEAVHRKGTKFTINRTKWWVSKLPNYDYEFLWCELPSGRRLAYPKPEIKYEPNSWGEKRAVLYHWGVNSLTRKWESSGTYGGKLAENVVQAISRDLMAEAMLRLDHHQYQIILTVHDEILAERQKGFGTLADFKDLMAELPAWAAGCPVKVEGWEGERYKK